MLLFNNVPVMFLNAVLPEWKELVEELVLISVDEDEDREDIEEIEDNEETEDKDEEDKEDKDEDDSEDREDKEDWEDKEDEDWEETEEEDKDDNDEREDNEEREDIEEKDEEDREEDDNEEEEEDNSGIPPLNITPIPLLYIKPAKVVLFVVPREGTLAHTTISSIFPLKLPTCHLSNVASPHPLPLYACEPRTPFT